MRLYRLLTSGDALNKGWELYGSPVMSFDTTTKKVVCGQAVVKDVVGVWTDAMKAESFKLSGQ